MAIGKWLNSLTVTKAKMLSGEGPTSPLAIRVEEGDVCNLIALTRTTIPNHLIDTLPFMPVIS